MPDYNVTIKRHNGSTWEAIYPKTTAENIISGVLDDARIPSLGAGKITSGSFHVDRIPNLDAAKIASGSFATARIPNLDAAKIASGVLADARIPNLAANKITSGAFHVDRIPNLDASKIASGTIDAARLPAIALTNVITSTTMANFLTIYSPDPTSVQEGDVLILTTDKKTYIHNGGTAGTAADFTLMETPTDAVTSVAGKTGVVTLVKGDVGLGNVPNVDATNPANISQSSSYRFVNDSEKSAWNAKVDTLSDLGITVDASKINNAQSKILLVQDTLLSGYTADPGDVAFTW